MELLNIVGIFRYLKSFIVFFFYGLIATLFIGLFYDLNAELPDVLIATLSGPISITMFGWLSLFGVASLALATNWGREECSSTPVRRIAVNWIALPVCETAITLGIVMSATLLGVACCSHSLYVLSLTDTVIHPQFYGLSVFMLLITYPVIYFTIALLDNKKFLYIALNASAFLYLILIITTFYFPLPVTGASIAGTQAFLLMAGYAFLAYPGYISASGAANSSSAADFPK